MLRKTPERGSNTMADRRIVPRLRNQPRFVRAIVYFVIALAALVVSSQTYFHPPISPRVISWTCAAVFLVFGVLATRDIASSIGHVVANRTMQSAGAVLRLVLTGAGYIIVIFGALGILNVPIEHLLVGGAITGVVLGIAAQQSLGNVFAGIVLLLARPFVVGQHIVVRSGSLGGQFDGVVLAMSLTYVTIRVDDVRLKIPNSVLLAAGIGPFPASRAKPQVAGEKKGEPN